MFAGYRHCKKCGKALMGLFDGALCDECEEEENRRMKDYEQIATNIMMTALEGVKAQIRKAYDKGCKNGYVTGYDHGKRDGYEDGKADTPFTDTKEAENKAYNRGLNDAWEVARKIIKDVIDGGYSSDVLREIFGVSTVQIIFKLNTAVEVIAKIKAYEDKQDAKIKVGDEVVFEDAHVVITYISPSNEWNGFLLNDCESGKRGHGYTLMKGFNGWRKTGRHFPQIAEVLAELRGAEYDT